MAEDVRAKSSKKKPGSKWRKRANIAGIGSREKGQGFAQIRRAKAIREYKKLLKKTRKEQQTSSYVQKIYESEQSTNVEQEGQERVASLSDSKTEENKNYKECMEKLYYEEKKDITSSKPTGKSRKRVHTKTRFSGAEKEYKRKKFDIERNKKEREQEKERRIEELQKSLDRRRKNNQQLMKRTRRGQPIMANQINYLLSKIQ